jgi:hypothetical protein
MPIIVKDGGDFENHPEGQYRAICMDVVDLGMIENKKWGKMQHKIALVFHTEAKMKDGRPFEIWERFTATLADNGYLRPFLQNWRGKAFTPAEVAGFDLETLIGASAYIQVLHNESNGKTYANIDSIMKLPKGTAKLTATEGYERRKDRKTEVSQTPEPVGVGPSNPGDAYDAEDDDLPF